MREVVSEWRVMMGLLMIDRNILMACFLVVFCVQTYSYLKNVFNGKES